MLKKYGMPLFVALAVSACAAQEAPPPEKPDIAGITIGKETDTLLIKRALGGTLGFILTETMDVSDREKIINAYEYNPDQHTSKWVNQLSGNQFSVTMQLNYIDSTSKLECRDGEIFATVSGTSHKSYATACRWEDKWYFR